MKLADLLTVPMQRFLKYHLLINEILKHTPLADEEAPLLAQAHSCIVEVGEFVNEGKRDFEIMTTVRDVQNSVDGAYVS